MSDYDPSGCWRRTAEILFGYNRDPVGFPMRLANIFGMVHNIDRTSVRLSCIAGPALRKGVWPELPPFRRGCGASNLEISCPVERFQSLLQRESWKPLRH
jgi:hypothetical protein